MMMSDLSLSHCLSVGVICLIMLKLSAFKAFGLFRVITPLSLTVWKRTSSELDAILRTQCKDAWTGRRSCTCHIHYVESLIVN
jgi:hypothetical protein